MTVQNEDLLKAERDLRKIIEDVTKKMEVQFKEQFAVINGYFSETFKELFGGGRAELRLENSEDILGSGIEIVAQPPGKALQLLSLLSGGERALTAIAILFGTVSGCAPDWLDRLLMRLTEILLSVPNLLLVVLLQAILGTANVLTLSLVIGLTSWASIAKVVRTEVRRLRSSEYVLASRCMGGGFFHVLRQHLAPNFFSSISFMVVMNIRSAITAESTLSFLGIGLPIEVVSWGSMLSLSEKALLTDAWWIIVIPGVFLVATLLCITELANVMRRSTRERTL